MQMFKILFKFITIFCCLTSMLFAEVFSEFNVEGNVRVSKQTIINFSELKKGMDLDDSDLNNTLKKIYETNFFEKVSLNINNKILNINVKEFPIIQDIIFNGIKAKKFVKKLNEDITLKPKSSFNNFILKKDINKILNILKQSGYYFAKVEVREEINPNNTINIIYDVTMGEKALIKKIKFIGDKKFKSRKLFSVITSEENKIWKFLSKSVYLNKERTNLDKRLLENFYLNNGYYDVKIEQAFSQVLDAKNFSLTYKITSGDKFLFNTFSLSLPDDFEKNKFENLKKIFKKLENSTYSYKKIEFILDEIDKIALIENYEFIDADVTETIVEKNKIDFNFNIKESNKFYVERINISGNDVTEESFIRHNLVVDEGDPYNKLLHNKTINKLKSTRIFKSVKSDVIDGDTPSQKILNIAVVEQPTGEITAGAGYGSTGSSFQVGIKENNFKGQGVKLDLNLTVSAETVRGKFSHTNPNFAYSDRSVTTSLQSTAVDKEKDAGYKSSLNKFSMSTYFEQFEDFYFSPKLSISNEALTTTAKASANYKKQEGSYFDTLFYYQLSYDKRDSVYRPTSGYVSTWIQELPIISDGASIINGYQFTSYKEIMDDMILTTGIFARAVSSISGEDVRVSKRLFLPSKKLHGFEAGMVGPKDGNDYVGGNYMASFNVTATLPFLFPTFENVDFLLFFDAANVWHADYSAAVDQGNTVRSATGVAVDVLTPIGPLSFSFSQPLSKADSDVTESFRFNLGTTF